MIVDLNQTGETEEAAEDAAEEGLLLLDVGDSMGTTLFLTLLTFLHQCIMVVHLHTCALVIQPQTQTQKRSFHKLHPTRSFAT